MKRKGMALWLFPLVHLQESPALLFLIMFFTLIVKYNLVAFVEIIQSLLF